MIWLYFNKKDNIYIYIYRLNITKQMLLDKNIIQDSLNLEKLIAATGNFDTASGFGPVYKVLFELLRISYHRWIE